MLVHPNFDPIALQLGPIAIHWYGLMYLAGFLSGWALGRYHAQRAGTGWTAAQVDDIVFYIALGVIVGGRLGYLLFYGWQALWDDPLSGFYLWRGGMSFHGGFLGVLVAMVYFARQQGKGFWETTDFIAPLIPPGLFFGRVGNFINGELWGKVTDVPWGMVFPQTGDGLPRHPSQLYEMGLEGLCLFVLLWWFSARQRPTMAVSGAFLLGYGLFRTGVETFRQPDAHIGYLIFESLTMGQLLSIPMVLVGIVILGRAYRKQ